MATTLTYATTTLSLPDDLLWPNEFDWRPVEQTTRYTILGALRVESAAKQAGRPITLQGGIEGGTGWAFIQRSTVETLHAWTKLPGQVFTLVYRGVTYSVVFDQDAGPLVAEPVHNVSDPGATDWYVATLRFLEV